MQLSNFIIHMINKDLDDENDLYITTQSGAQHHECHIPNRDMHKGSTGLRALSLFSAKCYYLAANDRTDTIILPGSPSGLPEWWDLVTVDLCHGHFFVRYAELVFVDGPIPLLLSSH